MILQLGCTFLIGKKHTYILSPSPRQVLKVGILCFSTVSGRVDVFYLLVLALETFGKIPDSSTKGRKVLLSSQYLIKWHFLPLCARKASVSPSP